MTLIPGSTIGSYEILAPLGAGGMGEVYRARDPKLAREVAIKLVSEAFAAEPDRVARFQREAQLLAALNHPHIAAIYGFEEQEGTRFLVLELVEGETIAEKLEHLGPEARSPKPAGGLPVREALDIARQIADALEAAHEKGIIHRDLKPANVKITPDGVVKVLDFGLAKALDTDAGGDPSTSPTLTAAATRMGVILGTAAYMSPEQAKGKPVDKRADVWAFGCVLYEMLTRKRPFDGEDISDTMAAVLRAEPDWNALPADTPPGIVKLVRGCLQKDRKERVPDIGVARLEIRDALARREATAAPPSAPAVVVRRRSNPLALSAAVLAGAIVGAAILWTATRPAPAVQRPVQRLTIDHGANVRYVGEVGGGLAVSPDGTRLVYPAFGPDNKRLLYMRSLDQLEPQPLRGTDGAYNPFFSPDSEWIGFFDSAVQGNTKLKKVAVRGGPPVTISAAFIPVGAWEPDGQHILMQGPTQDAGWNLFRVPAAGGTPTRVAAFDPKKGERRMAWPDALPDGRTALVTIATEGNGFDQAYIAALSLETGSYRKVIEQGYNARYVPSGHVVYVLAGNLMAVPFDAQRRAATGPPVPVIEGIRGRSSTGEAGFAVASTGFLVHAPGANSSGVERLLMWIDRAGKEEVIPAPAREYVYPRLSPDGTRLALDVRDQEDDIWIWDFTRRTLARLTFQPALDTQPHWTPDGQRILFGNAVSGSPTAVYGQSADGTGQPERILGKDAPDNLPQLPQAVSPDGKSVIVRVDDPKTLNDLYVLALADRRLTPLIRTPFQDQNPAVSPDGRWIAYQSNESGSPEVYVRPFPDVDAGKWQVSNGGGRTPLWSRDGRELFYVSGPAVATRMMTVPIQAGSAFAAGTPQQLFETSMHGAAGRTFDVSPDGKRFLIVRAKTPAVETQVAAPFVITLNWFDELKRLAPAKP